MELSITYETLFDLLRKERSLEELQSLDSIFWNQVVIYLNDRNAFLEKTSQAEKEKTKLQLRNIKRILKEIYERREQKIVNLALNVIRSDSSTFVDKRNMLLAERELFDEVILLLTKYKQGVLLQVFQYRNPIISTSDLPDMEEGESPDTSELKKELKAAEENDNIERDPVNIELDTKKDSSDEENADTDSQSSDSSSSDDLPEMKVGTVIVKFISSVPKFYGKNKQIFGPYDEGKIAQLPANIANILLKKGKVKHVLA